MRKNDERFAGLIKCQRPLVICVADPSPIKDLLPLLGGLGAGLLLSLSAICAPGTDWAHSTCQAVWCEDFNSEY